MLNFDYYIPTEVFFGEGQIEVLPEQIAKYGKNVLLVYGGSSIKRNGIYDKIVGLLQNKGLNYWELGGVEPNPRVTTITKGVEICREHDIDIVLAIGGGSTIDCSKGIAAAYYYDGEAWDIVVDDSKITKLLPIGCVVTIAATGSEMDNIAVISNMETNQKIATRNRDMYPKFAILDPTYTYTVPPRQVSSGIADILSHAMESYFSSTKDAYLPDRIAEAIMKTCIHFGPIAMKEPKNYEARGNLMWAASLAINSLTKCGKAIAWSCHPIEHVLSAHYDVTHGIGLAIITPYWMKQVLNQETAEKFAEFGVNVWGLPENGDTMETAKKAIEKTADFFKSIGLPSTLSEIGVPDDKFELMAAQVTNGGTAGNFKPMTTDDVLSIFKAAK